MTFRARLILSIAAIEALLLVALSAIVLTFGEQAAQQRMRAEFEAKARLAAIVLRAPVAADDNRTVEALTRDLAGSGDILRIAVTQADGRTLAEATGSTHRPRRLVPASAQIVDHGRVVGVVTLQGSGDFLEQILTGARLRLTLAACGLLILSAAASWWLGGLLTRRLSALRRTADAVARGAFEQRLPEDGPPELAAAARAMNTMAAHLGDLYARLDRDLAGRRSALASTFHHMTQGVAIFDAEGKLVEANEAFPSLVGLPVEAIVQGVTLDELVDIHVGSQAEASPESQRLEALCRSRDWQGPSLAFEIPLADDRVVAVQRTRLPAGGFIGIHEDVTRQRQDERRLLHAAKLTTLGRLATAAAHELNQPLNVIRLTSENAAARLDAGTATSEYLSEKLVRIAAQTDRAARIIDHMRIFGRKPEDEARLFDLGDTVRSASEFFGETARIKGYRLELSVEEGLIVEGHPILIEQVVANILSNAFAALNTTTPAAPRVTVTVANHDGRAHVEIADNAGGVPETILPQIFEPFFTTKADREGTGLGLSISYGIIADMKGRLAVRNTVEGAAFQFDLALTCVRSIQRTS